MIPQPVTPVNPALIALIETRERRMKDKDFKQREATAYNGRFVSVIPSNSQVASITVDYIFAGDSALISTSAGSRQSVVLGDLAIASHQVVVDDAQVLDVQKKTFIAAAKIQEPVKSQIELEEAKQQEELIDSLKHHGKAVAHLNAALEKIIDGESQDILLRALSNVAEAKGGFITLAEYTDIDPEALRIGLSSHGKLTLRTFTDVVYGMGLNLKFY